MDSDSITCITPELLAGLELTTIPTDSVWPPFNSKFVKAPQPLPENSLIKRPSLLAFGDGPASCNLTEQVLTEVEICEILSKHPHPNVVQYLGCVVEDDRITGLCLARYHMTLTEKVDGGAPFDRASCLRGIKDGMNHLHGLGLVHNDLNPRNVMVDSDGSNPVIIDFDSCKREGQGLGVKGGTDGWVAEGITHANRQNDFYGLSKIKEFLAGTNCAGQKDF
jgi:serine/threonine protein kinase